MPRVVTESARIVIKTEDGNRFEVTGKGSAPQGMLTAFAALSSKRRQWLLDKMTAAHADISQREKEKAS